MWLAAPPSDQLENRYCVPVVPACVAAAMVCVVAAAHCNEHGAVQATPSTVSDRPAGELVTVIEVKGPKLAVTLAAAFMVRFCGVVVPVSAPVKPVNW